MDGKRVFRMGAFDAADRPITGSLLFREVRGTQAQIGYPGQPTTPRAHVAGTAIYMGILFHHFGHFLLEGLARAWFAKGNPDLPIVWSVDEPRTDDRPPERSGILDRLGLPASGAKPHYKRWQSDLLSLLGIRNPPIFVARSTVFDQLIIPDVGYRIQTYLHPDHRDFLAVVEHRPEPGRRTWLSRARLREVGNRSAPQVDRRMADAGWDVVFPEQLPIAEQIRRLAASERVAGEQGSAFHMLLFLRNASRLKVDIFSRESDLPAWAQNRNYQTIAAAKGLDQTIHKCDSERSIRRTGPVVDKITENSYTYLSVLEGKNVQIDKTERAEDVKAPSTAASRFQELARIRNARTYLEIGVAGGKTFLPLNLPVKHAVDPEFRFDVREFESESVRFFEVPSDDFFLHFADKAMKYDLIFLDGLHTFEQTFRDFCSTQAHAHDGTIWVIDDVHPSDIFSANPDQRMAYKHRKLHGKPGHAWHGDVFKVLFAIHDFFPNLSYRTIVGRGNPQTVVIRRPRKEFRPKFGDLEKISRLTYYDFVEHRDMLNIARDEEMPAWLSE